MFKVIQRETVIIGEGFDFDRYEIEIKTPISTKELAIVVDFKTEEISGQFIKYGSWYDLPIEDCLEYANQIKKPIRSFKEIIEKYNKPRVYTIEVRETLSHTVEVFAKSKEDAIDEVVKKYNDEDIILTGDDLYETIFRESRKK